MAVWRNRSPVPPDVKQATMPDNFDRVYAMDLALDGLPTFGLADRLASSAIFFTWWRTG
jgi:hypothetical protein